MNKRLKNAYLLYAIIFALFTLLTFAIPFPNKNNSVFIIAWMFGIIAIAMQVAIAYIESKSDSLKSKVYGFPLVKVGFVYLIVQISLSFILYILNSFIEIKLWIVMIVLITILGLCAIGFIASDTYKETIEEMENSVTIDTSFINGLKTETKMIIDSVNDEKLKKSLTSLYDEIRYSDPVSSTSSKEVENKILTSFSELKTYLSLRNTDDASSTISEIIVLIKKRNAIVKNDKK